MSESNILAAIETHVGIQKCELQLDRAFENKIGRTGQRHIGKLFAASLEADLQFAATANKHADRAVNIFARGKNQRARDHAGAARERFIFDPALVGANGDARRPRFSRKFTFAPLGANIS